MTPRKRLIIFTTLFCITIIIFSSSMILGKHLSLEAKAQATTINKSTYRTHKTKLMNIEAKGNSLNTFFQTKSAARVIYLTFDDGPTEYTEEILKILHTHQVKSTFFMLNGNMIKRPEIVENVVADGHAIGCHGVTHRVSNFYKTMTSPREEMDACAKTLETISGKSSKIVRVPFGSFPNLTSAQKIELDKAEYVMWDWNVDSNDWKIDNPKKITQSVLTQVHKLLKKDKVPVILFHDKAITAKVLPQIITELKDLGYEFLPIDENDIPVQFQIHS